MSTTYGLLRAEDRPDHPFGRVWWCRAAWAHPLWTSYIFTLADLTTQTAIPPKVYLDGATHEFVVLALDPAHPDITWPPRMLQPPNHGYQFKAESNEAAEQRVVALLDMVADQRLSPDTDYRRVWDGLFADGRTLLISGLATHPAPEARQ